MQDERQAPEALRTAGGTAADVGRPSVRVLLASASPRRRQLMGLTGWPVESRPVSADETPRSGETGRELTRRLALLKAQTVAAPGAAFVLAADTTVVDGDELLGKPADRQVARAMLERLRGRQHRVMTSIALRIPEGIAVRAADGTLLLDTCESAVPMRAYSDDEIERYLASDGPFDKAGGYGIQDGGFEPVERGAFRDCYANVMGLPLCHVVRTMRRVGVEPAADVPAGCMARLEYDCLVHPAILGETA